MSPIIPLKTCKTIFHIFLHHFMQLAFFMVMAAQDISMYSRDLLLQAWLTIRSMISLSSIRVHAMRFLCTKQVNDQKEPSIWILISFHQLHVDCVKRVFPCKKSQSPNKYTWHERTYQPDDVALGDCVCNRMNDFLWLVCDNDREEEDVDDSSSRADNSDGDENRSNGDVFVFVNTFIWWNDSSALSTLPSLPNNRSADSLIKQNSGAASSRTANRNAK